MDVYRRVYDFAAVLGAFEGYVYQRDIPDPSHLSVWVDHLMRACEAVPKEVLAEFQDLVDGTAGRAVRSLLPLLGEDHEVIRTLKGIIKGEMPSSPDDFRRRD
jgi:hypothetical protein